MVCLCENFYWRLLRLCLMYYDRLLVNEVNELKKVVSFNTVN